MSGWITFWGELSLLFVNMGLLMGLTFSVLILLRPVTNRLLRPKHQVWLWFAGWYLGFLIGFYDMLGRIRLLPVSFRSLAIPRMEVTGYRNLPAFLPTDYIGAGDYTFALPGGAELPLRLTDWAIGAMGVLWVAVIVAFCIWDRRQNRRLRRIGQQGVKMSGEEKARYGLDKDNIVVRLCDDLDTSFVRLGNDTGLGDGTRFVICVQRELPPERLRLVLLHEGAHIRLHHVWYKSIVTGAMGFYWWNPIIWLAYRLTCRDMELACDQAVMEKLDEGERREYAKTLVELGSGRHLWGNITSFGECDAALRVKRVVAWKPGQAWRTALSWALAALLMLFFYCGGQNDPQAQPVEIPADAWAAYVDSPQLLQDLRAHSGLEELDIQELWSRKEKQLVLLDSAGEWYFCSMYWSNNRFLVSNITSMGEPFLNGYERLR